MEEAVAEELKLGELMRKDVIRELDVIQSMSTSLLVFDMKRKLIESHFDSLLQLIEKKRDEAVEAIRAREEEAKVADQRRAEEVKLREERLGGLREGIFGEIFARSKGLDEDMEKLELRRKQVENQLNAKKAEIDKEMKEVERRAAECDVKEKEMREEKIAVQRLSAELSQKEKEMSAMKSAVDDLTVQIQIEDERRNAACQRLSDENLALREEVKSLTQQLELKTQLPGREEQLSTIHKFLHLLTSAGIINVCNPIKHSKLSGEDLFILVREHINNQETATSKVSSVLLEAKDKAPDFVLEALRISYLSESEEQTSQSCFRPCRILLLEQLGQICPQAKSQVREEALKVAVEWSTQVESCANKSVELSRFLQFLYMYDIATEFSDEVLVPMLYCDAVHEGMPDFCFTLGFADRIVGYIKTMIENNERLKALEYVSVFKLGSEFSIVKIIREHLKRLKKNSRSMLKEGEADSKVHGEADSKMQVLDYQIDTLMELIKCIKDLELQRQCTFMNLEERVAKLKNQKYFYKRPAPCSDPSSDPEPLRKKGCKRSVEVAPNATNKYPEIGSSDLLCSGPSSDPEPLKKKGCTFHGIAKSADVAPNASNTYSGIGSIDVPCSNPGSDPEPRTKKECNLPGTAKSTEVAPNTSNGFPEIRSRDLLCSGPSSDPKPLKKKGCKLPGTGKSKESAPKRTLNAYPDALLHCQEMQKTLHFDRLQFPPYTSTSPGPSWYEPPPPRPPQHYHPCPPFGWYPQVPSWPYPVPEVRPYFDYRLQLDSRR